LIHISDFLIKVYKHLAFSNKIQITNDFSKEAYIIMYLGKNNDGWWKADDLVNQVVKYVISIFKVRFSRYQTLFVFDNTSSHIAFSSNALIIKHMNLNPDEKQKKMHSTYFSKGIQ